MKKVFIIGLLIVGIKLQAQISCDEAIELIKAKGSYYSSLTNSLMGSSWLYEVTAYTFNSELYVIAKIKRNEYSYSTDSYIFCGIPDSNWRYFKIGSYNDSESYGERFHKYIMDYKCNCN